MRTPKASATVRRAPTVRKFWISSPATFGLGGVIGCFSEGLQKMKVGGKSKLTCPPEIAYGERGFAPKISRGATLVFEIELLEIVGPPASEPAAAAEPDLP